MPMVGWLPTAKVGVAVIAVMLIALSGHRSLPSAS
jgi:hypothetical protein